jgi:hypothetical protein
LLITQEIKKTPVVIAQLLWQPFNVRFPNILQRLDHHREMLKFEIDFLQLKASGSLVDNHATTQHYQAKIEKHLKDHNSTLSEMQVQFSSQKHGTTSTHANERPLIESRTTLQKDRSVDMSSKLRQYI